MSPTSAPAVVVVGAGPVGLVAARELARRGVAIRVIDKLSRPTDESRAIAIHARGHVRPDGSRRRTRRIRPEVGRQVIAQTDTEAVLTNRLSELGVTVERGVELVALTQDADAVHLTLRRQDGSHETVDSRWVIGSDGGHKLADIVEEVNVSYQGSPAVLGTRPRQTKIVAGEHLPHIGQENLQKQLSVVCGAANPGTPC